MHVQFCADYTAAHLVPILEKSVQKLKLLTSNLMKTEKLKIYEKNFKSVSAGILRYLDISDSEYEEINMINKKILEEQTKPNKENETKDESKAGSEETDEPTSQLVLSSRNKAIEELPSVPQRKLRNLPKFTPKVKPKSKEKKKVDPDQFEITDYLKQKEILYPKLIKDIVNQFDKEMLVKSKKANTIGGKQNYIQLNNMFKFHPCIYSQAPPLSLPCWMLASSMLGMLETPEQSLGILGGRRCQCHMTTSLASSRRRREFRMLEDSWS